MNKIKKLLALLLCAAMTLGVMPAFALAAEQAEPVKSESAVADNAAPLSETTENPANEEPEAAEEAVPLAATGTYYPQWGIWFDTSTGTVTDADESVSGALNIPEAIDGVPVTAIGADAFRYCSNLTQVVIPKTVTKIGDDALYGTGIEEFTIPSTVKEFRGLFGSSGTIKKIIMEEGITEIPKSAFTYCSNLTEVVIPETVTTIGSEAFYNCPNLKQVPIPRSVTTIGSSAFFGTGIEEFTIPSTVKEFRGLFGSSGTIKKIIMEEGITEIPKSAFTYCSNLTEVVIPETVTTIGPEAFLNCPNLKQVIIPNSVTTIGSEAFLNCSSLKQIFIPESVIQIGSNAFYGCPRLTIYCAESSPAISAVIDTDIQFNITREITSYDHFVYKNTDYYSNINNMTGYVPFELKYEVKDGLDLTDKKVVIRIPSNSELIESTLKIDRVVATDYSLDKNKLTVPVEADSGMITFSVKPSEYNTLLTYAIMNFRVDGENKTEVIGVVNSSVPDISLKMDSVTNKGNFLVEGIAPPLSTIKLYVDDEQVGETTAVKSGNYAADINIPSPKNYRTYTVTAKADKNGSTVSADSNIKYREDSPALKSLVLHYGDHTSRRSYDLTDTSKVRPKIVYYPNYGFRFDVEMENADQIEELYVVSTRKNQKRYMDAEWDEEKGLFVAEGFFDGTNPSSYVPGEITIEYRKKKPDVEINFTLSDAVSQLLRDHIDKRFFDCKTEVLKNSGGKYEATVDVPKELGDLIGDEVEFFVEEIDKEYNDIQITDLLTEADNIYSYFFEKDGEKYVFNLDFSDMETVNMVVHDIADSKQLKYTLDFLDFSESGGSTTALKVSEVLEGVSKLTGSIKDVLEIDSDDEKLVEKIYAANMTDQQRAEALKKAEELRKGREMFVLISSVITVMTMGIEGPPALIFGLLFGAITTSSDFFWNMREGDILSTGTRHSADFCPDPSGYVYEAVDSNRVDGVTATAYWIAPEFIGEDGSFDENNAVVWDAAEYAQLNPLTTDMNGAYAWDVPEGLWQVRFEKDGYETAVTEWLPVPPPQTDVNVGMISTAVPTIMAAELYANSLTLTFDKYMQPETVENITIEGVSGVTVTPVDAEAAPDGTVYARSYSIGFNESLIGGTAHTVSVADAVSYAGTEMALYSRSLTVVKAEITDMAAKPYGDVVRVSVSAENVPAGAVVYLAAYGADGSMLSLNNAKFVDGIAAADVPIEDVVRVKALLWSNVSDMIPLCEAKEIEVTQ